MTTARNIGFNVKSMTCDMGTPNQNSVKSFGITSDAPFIIIDGLKVFFQYDVPHIIKCNGNNLKNHDYLVDGKVVSWRPVVQLREKERYSVCKLVPKLTDRHLNPDAFQKMNVSLATQVFSKTVADAIMSVRQDLAEPEEVCVATAEFLLKNNHAFDCLNSKSSFHSNPFKSALSERPGAPGNQALDFLKSFLPWIKTWKINTPDKANPPCFDGFYLTVNSILMQ